MTGCLTIAGLGPGSPDQITPAVEQAIAAATDVFGYIPYVARIAPRNGLVLHPSDNRVEANRALHALDMAAAGRRAWVRPSWRRSTRSIRFEMAERVVGTC